jgi:hypothetical protein
MPIFLGQFEVAVVYLVFFPSFLRAQELKRCSGVALVNSQGPRGTSFYGRLEGSSTFNAPECFEKGYTVKPSEVSPIDIEIISAYIFYKLARNDGFFMLPRDHEHFAAATTNAITADDYDHFMQGKKNYSMEELKKVPAKYHSEIKVFVKKEADKLRPHGQEDHEIRGPLHHLLEILAPRN